MSPFLAGTVWAITSLFIILLWIEKRRGVRYAASMRDLFDRSCSRVLGLFRRHTPSVNTMFFRQLFHFSIHVVLSKILRVMSVLDRWIRIVLRVNKTTARRVESQPDTHLTQLARHREEMSLSPEERRIRKETALRGE